MLSLGKTRSSFTLIEPCLPVGRSSFTLIELLVVLALVAILSVVVILTLNPAELIKQARDSNRLSDLATINTALNLFSADVTGGFMGTSTIVYVSIPSTTSTCSNLGLPTLPSGYTYNCVTATSTRNTDGTGWIPVNFQRISSNSPISQLPIDPINTTSTRLYYTYVAGGSWELNASIEASKNKLGGSNDLVAKDGGSATSLYEIGNNLNLNPIETGDTSLVGYWDFEEGLGATSTDRSGYGNNGSLNNNPTRIAGRIGSGAIQFNDAVYQSISTPNSSVTKPTGAVSVSLWMKAGVTSGTYDMIAANTNYNSLTQGYGLYFSANVLYFYAVTYAGGKAFTAYSDTVNWHHIVGTFDGSSVKIYVDGTFVHGVNISGPIDYTNALTGFRMGASDPGTGIYYYNGALDDVRIYNRALSSAEVLALYNATK